VEFDALSDGQPYSDTPLPDFERVWSTVHCSSGTPCPTMGRCTHVHTQHWASLCGIGAPLGVLFIMKTLKDKW